MLAPPSLMLMITITTQDQALQIVRKGQTIHIFKENKVSTRVSKTPRLIILVTDSTYATHDLSIQSFILDTAHI